MPRARLDQRENCKTQLRGHDLLRGEVRRWRWSNGMCQQSVASTGEMNDAQQRAIHYARDTWRDYSMKARLLDPAKPDIVTMTRF